MAAEEDGRIAAAIKSVLSETTILSLKEEQREALCAFLDGKDVCAFLPTGFGKSLIYQLAPLVVKKLERLQDPIVIVVSPLVALMDDQVKEAEKLGIYAAKLGDHENDVLHGKCQLVFGSPESWLLNTKWRNMLASRVYQDNLVGVVIDEVHATYKWGEGVRGQPTFRESFSKLGELRSIVRDGAPVLALTASAKTKHRDRFIKLLHMETATFVTVSPNRRNIRLGLSQVPANSPSCLDWIVTIIQEQKLSMSPIIIYCKSIKTVSRVFHHLKAELGEGAWVDKDQKCENLLIGMFHSKTLQQHKDRLLNSLNGEGNCRVVVASTALGMGLNFPNVSHIVMFGTPDDVEAIVQQVGRSGRHGEQSHAILYVFKQFTTHDVTVREMIANALKGCFRQALYSNFEESTTRVEPAHFCCTFCHSLCACESDGCPEPRPIFESFQAAVSQSSKCREVKPSERLLVQELLEEYMATLGSQTNQVFTSKSVCTGFSTDLIADVVEHCAYIFDLNYIVTKLPVFTLEHAKEILLIIGEVFGDIEYEYTTSNEDVVPDIDMYFSSYFDEEDDDFDIATPHSSHDSDTWYH